MYNFSDPTPLPLYPTCPANGCPAHPLASKSSSKSIRTTSTDDKASKEKPESVAITKQVSFTESTQHATSAHKALTEYRYPQKDQPTPLFMIGRYRFPAPARQLLPTSFSRPEHAPLHPGRFPSPQFKDEIWPSTPRCINDSHIVSMSPEHTYFGIDYVIDVHDLTWAQQPISRGTTIIFRNYRSNFTHYIATWKLKTVRQHTYVQFSPFRVNQETCYQDPGWPTIRIKVPLTLCKVPPSPYVEKTTMPSAVITPHAPKPKWWEVVCCCLCLLTVPYDDNTDDENFLKF